MVLFGMAILPMTAWAANIVLNPSSGNFQAGQTFTATVQVQPQGQNVNAVEAALSFDQSVLEVVNITRGPAFSLWTTEPTFSNSAGTINFGGGSPTPFTTNSNVVSVTFRARTEGTGSVNFGDVSILVADGQGTDVFANATNGSFTVAEAAAPPPPPPAPTPTPPQPAPSGDEESLVFGDPPRAPEIGSQTFLDANTWYQATEGVFSWSLPFDVSAVAVAVATSSDFVPFDDPNNVFDPPIDEFQITEDMVGDGIWYLSIAYQNQVGWGTVLNRRIQIDTTPPEPFEIEVRQGSTPSSFPTLVFEANDPTSGIDYYELIINNREPVVVTPDEARLGYLMSNLEDGTYTATVIAYDRAGNSQESSVAVLITAGWIPPVEEDEGRSFWDFFTAGTITIILLILIVILQGVYIWYVQKLAKQREEKLRRETREIQDQMEKIFSALRDEIYDRVNTITKRKRLSKSEKEAVESLNQALEVSETLIEKEINDVKSILK